jgi:hypothetical protein
MSMREDKYQRLYETHWARAFLIILILSVAITLLFGWLESR